MARLQLTIFLLINIIVFSYTYVVPKYEKSPEEGDLFEGDIAGIKVDEKGAAQIPTSTRVKWAGGVVPYVIDAGNYSKLN